MPFDCARYVARQQVVVQLDKCAAVKSRCELTQTRIKTERQNRENAVVFSVVQILGDTVRAGYHVAVAQNHALGFSGGAGGSMEKHLDDLLAYRREYGC